MQTLSKEVKVKVTVNLVDEVELDTKVYFLKLEKTEVDFNLSAINSTIYISILDETKKKEVSKLILYYDNTWFTDNKFLNSVPGFNEEDFINTLIDEDGIGLNID